MATRGRYRRGLIEASGRDRAISGGCPRVTATETPTIGTIITERRNEAGLSFVNAPTAEVAGIRVGRVPHRLEDGRALDCRSRRNYSLQLDWECFSSLRIAQILT